MNLLAKHFDTAFDAPDGIAKLRELILTLAMQGKLVPQDPKDPPASELLKQIAVEKKRLVKEGKIKDKGSRGDVISNPKKVTRGDAENAEINGPYKVPKGWVWTRLGDVGEINPRNHADDSLSAGFVPMPFVYAAIKRTHQFEERAWSEIKKGYTHFADGDIGLAKITPCFENGKSCVFENLPNGIGAGTTELHVFRNTFNSISPRFLLSYLKNPKYLRLGETKMTGSAGQKRVPTEFFASYPFPLPPLPEQKRIVAKIDQLMSLCDALEAQKKACHQKNLDVHAAAIHQLLSPSSATPRLRENSSPSSSANSASPREELSLSDAWAFLQNHFGDLYTVKENVAELRKAILQLAVMGKLVKQDPKDQPASELLKEIQREKARLVKDGKIKAPKALPEIKASEVPYEVPKGWVWTRLGEIVQILNGRAYKQQELLSSGTPVLRVGNLFTSNHWYYSNLELDDDKYINTGDLIYAWSASFGPFIWEGGKVIYHYHIWKLPFISPAHINKDYIFRYLFSVTQAIKKSGNGIAMMHMTKERMENYMFPLPPLPEQKRIVAKIDQLMSLCDGLEQQIDASAEKQCQLLSSLVSSV